MNFRVKIFTGKEPAVYRGLQIFSFEGLFQDRGGKRGLSSLEETEEDITIFPACPAPIVGLFLVCVIKTGIFLWKKL